MIYTHQHIADHDQLQRFGEEMLYKQSLLKLIEMIPMYKLKEIFPLEITEDERGTRFHIKVEL